MANKMKNMRKMKKVARKARGAMQGAGGSRPSLGAVQNAGVRAMQGAGGSRPPLGAGLRAMQGSRPPSTGKGGSRPTGPAQLASAVRRADMGGMQRMKGGGYLKKKIDGKASKGKTKGRVC